MSRKILLVSGARPNFMKVAALYQAMREDFPNQAQPVLLHTGQHFDPEMSTVFLEELGLPAPDHCLDAGALDPAPQMARIMTGFAEACARSRPDLTVVVGDVNSTLACALAARKTGLPVAHVEAGLRSFDPAMPEELNRILTDALSQTLFASEPSAVANLMREGRREEDIHLVGNVMIDTLMRQLRRAPAAHPRATGDFAALTLHRPGNVDSPRVLAGILEAVVEISRTLPVHFPLHPRTRLALDRFGLGHLLSRGRIVLHPPLGYREFLSLWRNARLVLTDSGGLQEETTALGVPCLTLRENTERPITLEQGTNRLAGTTREGILEAFAEFLREGPRPGQRPELWDGHAARRIMRVLCA